jgi:DNA-binding response OmpR family regulator
MPAEVMRRRRKDIVMNQKVLIVEDEFLIALDLEDVVTSCGLDVVGIANSADRAFEAAPLADIALVDVNLSDGATGPELGRRLAKKYGIAVIFMTANPEAVSKGVEGTLGVVRKPVAPRVIQETLKYAASRRTGQLAAVPSELRVFQP